MHCTDVFTEDNGPRRSAPLARVWVPFSEQGRWSMSAMAEQLVDVDRNRVTRAGGELRPRDALGRRRPKRKAVEIKKRVKRNNGGPAE